MSNLNNIGLIDAGALKYSLGKLPIPKVHPTSDVIAIDKINDPFILYE